MFVRIIRLPVVGAVSIVSGIAVFLVEIAVVVPPWGWRTRPGVPCMVIASSRGHHVPSRVSNFRLLSRPQQRGEAVRPRLDVNATGLEYPTRLQCIVHNDDMRLGVLAVLSFFCDVPDSAE